MARTKRSQGSNPLMNYWTTDDYTVNPSGAGAVCLNRCHEIVSEADTLLQDGYSVNNLKLRFTVRAFSANPFFMAVLLVQYPTTATFSDGNNGSVNNFRNIVDACIDSEFGYFPIRNPSWAKFENFGYRPSDDTMTREYTLSMDISIPRKWTNLINKEINAPGGEKYHIVVITYCPEDSDVYFRDALYWEYQMVYKGIVVR